MKKIYETPTIEKIAFRYRDQVVAASGGGTDTRIDEAQRMNGWGDTACGIGDAIVDILFDFANSSACQ